MSKKILAPVDRELSDFLAALHGKNWRPIGNGTYKESK